MGQLGHLLDVGERLNVVKGIRRCPVCSDRGELHVHEYAVRWVACGHTYALPPLPIRRRRRP